VVCIPARICRPHSLVRCGPSAKYGT